MALNKPELSVEVVEATVMKRSAAPADAMQRPASMALAMSR
jgi:hypothetical protein